ncbi:hypothetical protein CC86DRAFT_382846 [Ophiobolus disseminans]|uniref:Uncharacterized protein n=1 Tax=Ophiobolus disseminans TaxID=1469910 RepID=A0A6A6ZXT4_9PLEO|nr:hypothetical protein CC86DRAFT_382846 [Ophiobolus disseminans]
MKRPFCENATAINRLLAAHSHDPTQRYDNTPARTQPYLSVFHGARNECNQKFKSELKSIGDPDLAGVGVLTSQFIGMFLLMVFHVAALWPESIPLATCFLKSIRHFYVTATVLGFSITSAALATFLLHRSASDSLHDNFGYVNFYLNSMLALAPPLYAMPAVVLALMPPEALDKRSQSGKQIKLWDEAVVLPLMPPETPNKRNQWVKRMKLWDKEKHGSVEFHWAQLNAVILYTCCIVVMWIIWSRGVRDQHNPTLIVFGTRLNVKRSRSLFFLRDRCRDICILFGISQLGMFTYIRGQAIHQANGSTPEMNWGFGQILIVFTWVPLLLSIGSEIKSAF